MTEVDRGARPYRFERVEEVFKYIPDPFLIRTFDEVFRSDKFKWAGVSKGDLREVFEAIRFVVVKDGRLESHLFSLKKDDKIIDFTQNELKDGEAVLSRNFKKMLDEKLQREVLQTAAVMIISKNKSGERGTTIAYPRLLEEFCAPEGDVELSSVFLAWGILKDSPLRIGNCSFPAAAVNWAPGCDIRRGLLTSKRISLDWEHQEQLSNLPLIQSLVESTVGRVLFGDITKEVKEGFRDLAPISPK